MEKRKDLLSSKQIHFLEHSLFVNSGTFIHSSSYIGPEVVLGNNVKIGPFCTILGNVFIDDETRIYGNVVIGMPAEDKNTSTPLGNITIGKRCHIREFVSINASKYPSGKTSIGTDCYIMNFCYVSHDAILENNVTLINSVNLGGHAYIEHHATLMANSAIHQHCRVGAYSALAAFSATGQDILPFCMMNGTPAVFAGLNRIGLQRNNIAQEDINSIKYFTKLFFQEKKELNEIKTKLTTENLHENEYIKHMISFIESSKRGVTRKTIAD
jgi:UDP-N-acetylglucosamine acyltransferase